MFKREILDDLFKELDNSKITLIFGPRQVGKSFLMDLIYKKNRSKARFYDLEQSHDLLEFSGTEAEIQEELTQNKKIIFIDEFHYIKNAGKIFKAVYDLGKRNKKKQVKIFASGSSSIEIHKHIKESMAGRIWTYQIMPLTFPEYLSANRADLGTEEYFVYGGLPEVYEYIGSDREKYLNQILETYIQRDIKSLIREENISAFNKLIYMLAQYQGQIVSKSNLANELTVSAQTVESYLDILEKTFTIYPLYSFSTNLSNELKKSRKYYLYDFGIKNALIKNFMPLTKRKDCGQIYETYVLHYLLSIRNKANTDLFFWRTTKGQEVDFVWQQNQELIPIEVKTSYEVKEITPGLEAFLRSYPQSKKIILVFNKSKKFSSFEEFDYKGYRVILVKLTEMHNYLPELLQE